MSYHGRTMRPVVRIAVALSLAALAQGACSSSSSPGHGPAPPTGPVARFTLNGDAPPNYLDVPFPSDAYLQGGKVIEPIPALDAVFRLNSNVIAHAFAQMNGFSRTTYSLFYVDDPTAPPDATGSVAHAMIDPASLPRDEPDCIADTSSTFLVDLGANGPAAARVACRAELHDDTARASPTRPVLAIGPARGIVLEEGHHYAAVLTSRVKDMQGRPVGAGADFARIAGGDHSGSLGALYGGAFDTAHSLLAPALAKDGAQIVSMAVFTAESMSSELFQMRETVEAAPMPVLHWDAASLAPMGATKFAELQGGVLPAGFTASLDALFGVVSPTAKLPDGSDDPDSELPVRAHDKIAALGTAEFTAINFLVHKPGGYSDLDDATLAHDATGKVIPAPGEETERIWVTIALPTAPMPPNGYPAVIFQHGISNSRLQSVYMLNTFCNAGWAAVAIDSITFGARAAETEYQVDQSTTWQNAPGAAYKGPDGFADPVNGSTNGPADLLGNLQNLSAMRDQLRQAEIDTAQFVKMLRSNPDLSPLATGATTPKLDGSRIAYLGDSLGAVEGGAAAAIEPNVSLWALEVGGGDFISELVPHAPDFGLLVGAAGAALFGFRNDTFTGSHPMMVMIESVMEPGDPITYAPHWLKSPGMIDGVPVPPRNILQTEVVYDEIMANEATEALARAGGLGFATPDVGSNSGTLDIKNLANNVGRVNLPEIAPDGAGLIHDTPQPGITAVLVQQSPGEHGSNLVDSKAEHRYAIPYANYGSDQPFTMLAPGKQFSVRTGYRQLQATIVRFFADGFAGGVPNVTGFKPPVRDFDDDGATDDVDRDPSDPTVQ